MAGNVDHRIEIVQGDITQLDVGAVVNAANKQLKRGGGVDGAIHKAAGPKLQEACDEIGGCPTGQAVVTPGFNLPAEHVIHTVGPVYHGGERNEDSLLESAYRNSLVQAEQYGVTSIAFPAISTGVYGYPLSRATGIAVRVVRQWLTDHDLPERVIFCAFDAATKAAYESELSDDAT
jgi:O-acetyl-ADP-ribose deacetylase (regulator of RNase III)